MEELNPASATNEVAALALSYPGDVLIRSPSTLTDRCRENMRERHFFCLPPLGDRREGALPAPAGLMNVDIPVCFGCGLAMRLVLTVPSVIPAAETRVYTCDSCKSVSTRRGPPG